jgi:thioredoxin-dependent peroxiredoxin
MLGFGCLNKYREFMTLEMGDPAPNFTLGDGDGNSVALKDLRGQWVVLFFYPKDNTPGCTKEACGFRDQYEVFQADGTVILGLSLNDAKSHAKFSTKYALPFPLLCDSDAAVSTAYESYGLKKFMGKESQGIYRQTFIIDPEGNLAKIYRKVKPEPHAEQVLEDLKALKADRK